MKKINFIKTYTHKQFIASITRFGNYKEAEIETTYNNSYIATTAGELEVVKRRNSDGIISYIDDEGMVYSWIQETKNGRYTKITKSMLKTSEQYAQGLYYYFYNFEFANIKSPVIGIIGNTENYYSYIILNENTELLDQLRPLYRDTRVKSACHVKEDKRIINLIQQAINKGTLNIHLKELTSTDDLTKIYNKVINYGY